MEMNKPNDKRSRSAPCVNERAGRVHASAERSERTGRVHASKASRTVRFCFAVMTISLLVFSMFAPASAMMLGTEDPASNVTYRSCLTGVAGFSFRDNFADYEDPRTAETPIGGIMPTLSETGYGVYANSNINSFKPASNDGYYSRTAIWRYKTNIQLSTASGSSYTYSLDKYRHTVYNFELDNFATEINTSNPASFLFAYLRFDDYYFPYDGNNGKILDNLVTLRLLGSNASSNSYSVTVNLRFSYYLPNGQLSYGRFSRSFNAGNSNIASVLALDGFATYLKNSYPEVKTPLLISDFTISLNSAPHNFASNYIEFELLGMQYSTGTPTYINLTSPSVLFAQSGDKLVTKEIQSLNDEIQRLNKVISDAGMGGGAWNPLAWVFNILGGFLGLEIMPGFSVGGVLGVCATVCIMLVILKFFGGG